MSDTEKGTVLVAGASGFVGGAIIEHFAAAGWDVIGLSRRRPAVAISGVRYEPLDLLDRDACARAAGSFAQATHFIYAAVNETMEEIGEGWGELPYVARNAAMFANLFDPLLEQAGALRHTVLMHGAKAYAPHRPDHLAVPLRESAPRPPFDDFYFRQEDHLARHAGGRVGWTVFRPMIIAGGGLGSNLNGLLAICVFAALRRAAGQDLPLPAHATGVVEMTDVELLARGVLWSATAQAARNQVFNIANGDVFVWPDLWPVIAGEIGVKMGEPVAGLSLKAEIAAGAELWARLVARHALPVPADIGAYLGASPALADFALSSTRNVVMSTIKIRQAGFGDCIDTADSVVKWIRRWRAAGMLPPR